MLLLPLVTTTGHAAHLSPIQHTSAQSVSGYKIEMHQLKTETSVRKRHRRLRARTRRQPICCQSNAQSSHTTLAGRSNDLSKHFAHGARPYLLPMQRSVFRTRHWPRGPMTLAKTLKRGLCPWLHCSCRTFEHDSRSSVRPRHWDGPL